MKYTLLGIFMFLVSSVIWAQVPNDVCQYATPILSVDNYCSEPAEFTNVNAEEDTDKPNSTCLFTYKNAVWFSFVPLEPAVNIRITGSAGSGTLDNPQIGVYSGTCGNLTQTGCTSVSSGQGVAELIVADLVIGQTYYLMVDGFQDQTGSFQICINDFIPIPETQPDCKDGVILCDKTSFQVESLVGIGQDKNEVDKNSCIAEEFASSWYKWTCDKSGTLTFVITPNNNDPSKPTDDIDFAVYKLPGGLDDCEHKEIVRCCASGANQGTPYSSWAICNGPTGLSTGSTDLSEAPGCDNNSDNFVAALNMVSGESYVLVVNNFSQSGLGFSIDFGGTGTFLGPKVDFAVDAVADFECDQTITFTDSSYSDAGNIVSWNWNFGAGANPVSASTTGPHQVVYESFGDKIAALTIENEEGCRVTKIVDFYVESCCEDFPDIDVTADPTDNLCAGDSTGIIFGQGIAGHPQYSYSLDGIHFSPNPQFPNLPQGDYVLYIQDIKGCRDSTEVSLVDPPPLFVTAGPDIELTLGDSSIIPAFYTPADPVDIQWFGHLEWLRCDTCLAPIARPFESTDYTIQVTNENGCTAEDDMHFTVNIIRPFWAPNAFSPNGDGHNDWFNLFSTGIAIDVDELMIFDRWGDLIYRGQHVPLNDPSAGWNGYYKGKKMNPDVYIWVAKIRYLDNVVIQFSGDVTLVGK